MAHPKPWKHGLSSDTCIRDAQGRIKRIPQDYVIRKRLLLAAKRGEAWAVRRLAERYRCVVVSAQP
jgi:hypothetical protein